MRRCRCWPISRRTGTTPPLAGPRRSHARSQRAIVPAGAAARDVRRCRSARGRAGDPAATASTDRRRSLPDGRTATAGRRRTRCRGSSPPNRSRPISSRPVPWRPPAMPTTFMRNRPCLTRPVPGSWPTPPPTRRSPPVRAPSCTCGSSTPRPPTGWSARWRRSRPCCVTGPGRRGSSSTCPRRAADRRCPWSSDGASPTTPSCSPRSAGGSATASSTCAS